MSRETVKNVRISILIVFAIGIVLGIMIAQNGPKEAKAAGGKVKSPTGAAPDRYVYYPGTEELRPNEMRVIACGTGMPAARKGQAATSFLVELGNGDKFIFDIGTHSMENTASLMIPYDYLDKVFLSHLHTDHWGDLATLWAGGWTAGRTSSLKVWGPSGKTKDMGTKYAVEHFMKTYNWDYQTRLTGLPNIQYIRTDRNG
jgi:ribonuclease Z